MNGIRYLTWTQLLRSVKRDRRYKVARYGGPAKILEGLEILEHAAWEMNHRDCSHVEWAQEVSKETQDNPMDLWDTVVVNPRTGARIPAGDDESMWLTRYFLGPEGEKPHPKNVAMMASVNMSVEMLAIQIMEHRQEKTGVKDQLAADAAYEETLRALIRGMNDAREMEGGDEYAHRLGVGRAQEVFDRAFGRERIRSQGIDLDQHPRWHHYRAFYDRGLPPPTHREAADLIIELMRKAETK